MIHKRHNLHAIGELCHAAHMIAVIMRDQDIINLLDLRRLCSAHNPLRISPVDVRPSRIDQHRFARWAYNQRRLPSLDVNEIDLKWFRSFRGRAACEGEGDDSNPQEPTSPAHLRSHVYRSRRSAQTDRNSAGWSKVYALS